MDSAVWGFIGVIVGGLITGIVTIGAAIIHARADAGLDSAKRTDNRRLARDQFQRETLLALQDAAKEHARIGYLIDNARRLERMGGGERSALLSDELGEGGRVARMLVVTLASRVEDEETRRLALALSAAVLGVALALEREDEDRGMEALGQFERQLVDRSGHLKRKTFLDPAAWCGSPRLAELPQQYLTTGFSGKEVCC